MKIIDSYDTLPLGIYLDIMALCEDAAMEEDDRQLQIISLLTGETEDTLLKLPILEFRELARKAQFLEVEAPRPAAMPAKLRLGDMTLIPTTKVTKLTTAQFVDYQTFAKEGHKRLVEQLSCFLIPQGCDYGEGYDMEEVHAAIREYLTVTQAQGLAAFFFGRWRRYVGSTLIYSAWKAKRIREPKTREETLSRIREAQAAFKSAGDGSTAFAWSAIPPIRRGIPCGR